MTKDRPNDTKREKQPGKPGKGRDTTPKEGDKADGERIAKRLARAGVASRRDAEAMIEAGFRDFADRWNPILDVFDEVGVRFALEVHPTEIAFDISTAQRASEAVDGREAFGFNYDPSHFAYQAVDYPRFLRRFADRVYHVHMKDVWWSGQPTASGVFGGHLPFGHVDRFWDFRSLGRGNVDFEEIVRELNRGGYAGPLSVEWEDSGMDREHGAEEACDFVHSMDFPPSGTAFDAAFDSSEGGG